MVKGGINHRECTACKKSKHIKRFPLIHPDEPNDSRRLKLCETCTTAAMRIVKKTPAYKAYRQAMRRSKVEESRPDG